MAQPTEEGLVRGIGRWSLVAVAINGIIGAGIFGLPSRVFSLIGPYSVLAFAVCAVVVTLIILCFAEVASRFRETGGPYLYARDAFGPVTGFQVGWMMWLARLTAFAANCNLLVSYLSYFWQGAATGAARVAIILIIVVTLTAINIVGVRDAARFSNLFAIGKLIPIILFVAVGLFFINVGNFSAPAPINIGSFSESVLLLVYAFTGFEMAVIPAGEVSNPQRNLPAALLIAIGVVAVLYILIQIVSIGTLPELASSERPLADASNQFLGAAGASIITAGALISITGNLNVLILAGSRLPFAMGERRELPHSLAFTHNRFRTPYVAILFTSAVMLLLTLWSTFASAVKISTIARLIAYAATCAALMVLRYKSDARPAVFRLPFGIDIAVITLALSVWLISNTTFREVRDVLIAALIGRLLYLVCTLIYRRLKSGEVADSTKS
ncbi:MAG TPA: amino acid permease [Blastocatellia bacterium]|nr:amino acid permease [Blastocatellia bacterium]